MRRNAALSKLVAVEVNGLMTMVTMPHNPFEQLVFLERPLECSR